MSGSTVDKRDGDDERRGDPGEVDLNNVLALYAEEVLVRKPSASFWDQFHWGARVLPVLTHYAYVTGGFSSF